ncbi:MAG: hypothetical protein ACRD3Q_08090 [Terriglobales bacterium]
MKKKISLVAVMLGMFLAMSMVALADDAAKVGGTWEMTMQGRQGPVTNTLTIDQSGNTFKWTLKTMRGETPVEGKIDGNKISFNIERDTPNGKFTQEFSGTVDGDSIKGTVKMGEREMDWTAKKK